MRSSIMTVSLLSSMLSVFGSTSLKVYSTGCIFSLAVCLVMDTGSFPHLGYCVESCIEHKSAKKSFKGTTGT